MRVRLLHAAVFQSTSVPASNYVVATAANAMALEGGLEGILERLQVLGLGANADEEDVGANGGEAMDEEAEEEQEEVAEDDGGAEEPVGVIESGVFLTISPTVKC